MSSTTEQRPEHRAATTGSGSGAGNGVGLVAAVARHEMGRSLAGVAAVAAGLAVLTVVALGIGSGLQSSITSLTDDLPEAFLAFVPGDVPGGYVVGEVVNLIAPVAVVAWAVLAGARTLAGDERDGTMSVLASLPLSRTHLLAAKTLALLMGVLVIVVVLGATLAVSSAAFDTGLSTGNAAATMLHLALLAAFLGGLGLAVGAATGRPTVASASAGGVAVVAYLADAMLPLAGLDGLARLSPWHYYASSTPLANGVDPLHVAVLAGLGSLVVLAAFVVYPRRDLEV